MAVLRVSWQSPVSYLPKTSSSKTSQPNTCLQIKSKPIPICAIFIKSTSMSTINRRTGTQFFIKATEEKDLLTSSSSDESESKSESVSSTQKGSSNESQPTTNVDDDNLSELGSEIRKALKERDLGKDGGGGGGDFWGGVAEEIREIEWPPFPKVLGITGVVLGVIAGSSVVLLTVNAVLAELSDKVFAGKGVQDFFT